MAWPRVRGMRAMEFGTPGPFRAELNELVLAGVKTATTGLLEADYRAEQEDVEHVGELLAMVGDEGEYLATIEITSAEVRRFDEVPVEHARAEGEGWETIEAWRRDHVGFWSSGGHEVTDETPVVCLTFRLVGQD